MAKGAAGAHAVRAAGVFGRKGIEAVEETAYGKIGATDEATEYAKGITRQAEIETGKILTPTRGPAVRDSEKLNEEAEAESKRALKESEFDRYQTQMTNLAKIEEMNQEIADLAAKGEKEAADKLTIEKEALETKKQQAETEREKAEAEKASAAQAQEISDAELEIAERKLRMERDSQAIREQHDPVTRYMRKLKELQAAFEETEHSGEIFQRALRDIKEELVESSFRVNVEFGLTGMDAVRKGTVEEQQLIMNTLEMLAKKKEEEKNLAEVKRRQDEIDLTRSVDTEGAAREQEEARRGLPTEATQAPAAEAPAVRNFAADSAAQDAAFTQPFPTMRSTFAEEEAAEAAAQAQAEVPAEAREAETNAQRVARLAKQRAEQMSPEERSRIEGAQLARELEDSRKRLEELGVPSGMAMGEDAFNMQFNEEQLEALRRNVELTDERNAAEEATAQAPAAVEPRADPNDMVSVEDKKSLAFQDRIAKAVEKMADRNPIVLEPLGGIA
jgi:hypothetical protein